MGSAETVDLSEVDQFLEQAVTASKVAGGCVLVLHRGKVVYNRGFGYADIATQKPFTTNMPVIVASISKPLLGTAAFRLQEQGLLNLAEPISNYLPAFGTATLESGEPIPRAPTMVELLTHTAGLRGDTAPGGRPWFATWIRDKSLAQAVDRFAADVPFKAAPGTKYAYSGIGTDIAARTMEVVTGDSRNDVLVQILATPLGMTNTRFMDAASVQRLGPMPTRYLINKAGDLVVYGGRPVADVGRYSSSGGTVISTASDLARWLLMIRNQGGHNGGVFLSPETYQAMLAATPKSYNARGGLFRRKVDADRKPLVLGHTGSSGTSCWIDFEHDLIGILLTQTRGRDIKPFRLELDKRIHASFDR